MAATPRQVARLRYLGVRFNEPLGIDRAGVLIDKTKADPAFAGRIEQWHQEKHLLYPDLYPPTHTANVEEASSWSAPARVLPPLPNLPVLPASPSPVSGVPVRSPRPSGLGKTVAVLILGIVVGLCAAGGFAFWLRQPQPPPANSTPISAQRGPLEPTSPPAAVVVATPLPAPAASTPIPTPVPRPQAPTPASAKTAAESYQRARAKHPALDYPDTPFCKQFTAEMRRLKATRDPLLENPSYPEIIAEKLGRDLVRH